MLQLSRERMRGITSIPSLLANDVIDSLPFNVFSSNLILIIGLLVMSDASAHVSIYLLAPQLQCEWNLSSLQTDVFISIGSLGSALGNLYWGYLSDMHGRKVTLVICSVLALYFGLLTSAVPSYYWFLVVRFFAGFALTAKVLGFSYGVECVGKLYRGRILFVIAIFSGLANIYVGVLGFMLIQMLGWRTFVIFTSIPFVLFLVLFPWWGPESPRYLQNTGDYEKRMDSIHQISDSNIPVRFLRIQRSENVKRADMKILVSKRYRGEMLVMCIACISGVCAYYGLILLNTELRQSGRICNLTVTDSDSCRAFVGNDYLQHVIIYTAEIPGLLIPMLRVDYIGRKAYIVPSFLLSGIGFLCFNMCFSSQSGTIIMFMSRFVAAGLTTAPLIYAAEMFPTVVRTGALGVLTFISHLFMLGVPFVVHTLLPLSRFATTFVFAAPCFLSALLVALFLPETKRTSITNL